MGSPDRRRRSRSGRLLDALIWGTALGAAAGAVLGAAIDGVGAGVGALIGVLLYAPAEAFTTLSRGAAEVKPLWQRIVSSALLMALFGWLLGLIGLDDPLLVGDRQRCAARSARAAPAEGCARAAGGRRSGRAARSARRRCGAGAGRGGGGGRLSRGRGDRVPQPAAGPRDGRGGAGVRAALRGAVRGALAVRRCRLRRATRQGPRRNLPPQPARRRHPRLARQPRRSDVRRRPRAPADPRVLRAHQPLPALDRPRMAAVDEARIRDLQASGRASRSARPRSLPTSRKPSAGW